MAKENTLIGAAAFFLIAMLFIGLLMNQLTFGELGYGAVAIVLGAIGLSLRNKWNFASFRSKLTDTTENTIKNTKDIDDVWNDLQDWEAKPPRKTELKWNTKLTHIRSVMVKSGDGKHFKFISIITIDDNNQDLHIVIEAKTGAIVNHTPVKVKEEKREPFEYVPFVKQMMKQNRSFDSDEIREQMRYGAQGFLPGGYGGVPMNTSINPNELSGRPADIDNDDGEEDGGEDDE